MVIPIFFGIFFKKKSEKIGGVASSFSADAEESERERQRERVVLPISSFGSKNDLAR